MSTIKAPGHRNLTRETVTVRPQFRPVTLRMEAAGLGVGKPGGNIFQLF